MSEEHIERKRRRRKRRKRPAIFTPVAESSPENPALITPQQVVAEAAEEDDSAPLEPGRAKGTMIACSIPARYMDVLTWLSAARGQSIDQCVAGILRGHLTTLKPAYREATTGTIGGTARKGAEFNRLTERKRPDGAT